MTSEARHALRTGESVTAGWRRVSGAILDGALDRLRHPGTDPTEDIHVVRTSIKHLRALLRLIRPVLDRADYRAMDRRWKTTANHLSPLRDAAVGRAVLGRLAREAPGKGERRAIDLVRLGYELSNAPAPTHSHTQAQRAITRALEASRVKLRALRFHEDDWAAVGGGLEAIYRSARRRWKAARESGNDAAFHRWRTSLKHLLHALQFIVPIRPKALARLIAKLIRLHQRIGADHDFLVLRQHLGQQRAALGNGRAVDCVLRRIDQKRHALRAQRERQAGPVFDEKPAHFARSLERSWRRWRAGCAKSRGRSAPAGDRPCNQGC